MGSHGEGRRVVEPDEDADIEKLVLGYTQVGDD